ncbi:MAG: hypothetical protein U5K74_06190 [Gemmatimonadaceae bacterium]|nr:hypothetical protein [Gemmatimonadaceae bacterium]
MQLLLHPQQPRRLGLLQPRHGDAGPAADDEGDLLLAEHRPERLPALLPLLLALPDLRLQLALLVAQRRRALEVLVARPPLPSSR